MPVGERVQGRERELLDRIKEQIVACDQEASIAAARTDEPP